jgi:arsenate reductase (glutaredoxin)
MDEIVIYEKATCSTCRAADKLLDENGVVYRRVRYHDTPLTAEKLRELIAKMGTKPHELLRKNESLYKSLEPKPADADDEAVIELMLKHPDLMQRPILERGERAILGRPVERLLEFLNQR